LFILSLGRLLGFMLHSYASAVSKQADRKGRWHKKLIAVEKDWSLRLLDIN
jgi:hypothetical protein